MTRVSESSVSSIERAARATERDQSFGSETMLNLGAAGDSPIRHSPTFRPKKRKLSSVILFSQSSVDRYSSVNLAAVLPLQWPPRARPRQSCRTRRNAPWPITIGRPGVQSGPSLGNDSQRPFQAQRHASLGKSKSPQIISKFDSVSVKSLEKFFPFRIRGMPSGKSTNDLWLRA